MIPPPEPSPQEQSASTKLPRGALAAVGALGLLAVLLVALSLRSPDVPEYAPTPVAGLDGGASEPQILTVDASDPEKWRYVDLARGSVVDNPADDGWDLAFRRFEVQVNGGEGFAGSGGVLDLGAIPLDSVQSLPTEGYAGMTAAGRDTSQVVLDEWYTYSFTSHVLRPKDQTLGIRTAKGRHVALRFLSYYCTGAQPGCMTVRYVFR